MRIVGWDNAKSKTNNDLYREIYGSVMCLCSGVCYEFVIYATYLMGAQKILQASLGFAWTYQATCGGWVGAFKGWQTWGKSINLLRYAKAFSSFKNKKCVLKTKNFNLGWMITLRVSSIFTQIWINIWVSSLIFDMIDMCCIDKCYLIGLVSSFLFKIFQKYEIR